MRSPRPQTALKAATAALALLLGACGGGEDAPPAAGTPTIEVPAEGTAPEAPEDPALPPAAATTRDGLSSAAASGDWDAVAALLPEDPEAFTATFGGTDDPIAHYRSLPEDVLAELVLLLDGPSARLGDLTVWPDLHARTPFGITEEERGALEARYGAEALRDWETAGAYLGWRVGIQDDGTWRFLVAGD
ncbi:MAG: hypothetical protein RLZZ272_1036 [Actinomycetota bacterium]|jgi:hypothetical protein